jgi:hypothetical protein
MTLSEAEGKEQFFGHIQLAWLQRLTLHSGVTLLAPDVDDEHSLSTITVQPASHRPG